MNVSLTDELKDFVRRKVEERAISIGGRSDRGRFLKQFCDQEGRVRKTEPHLKTSSITSSSNTASAKPMGAASWKRSSKRPRQSNSPSRVHC